MRYALGPSNYIQFDLAPVEGGTRFPFTQYFGPGFRDADDGELESRDGAQPAGPGTPWRPGFLACFHFAFLDRFLAESWTDERIAEESWHLVDAANASSLESRPPLPAPEWERLVNAYPDHIPATIPEG